MNAQPLAGSVSCTTTVRIAGREVVVSVSASGASTAVIVETLRSLASAAALATGENADHRREATA